MKIEEFASSRPKKDQNVIVTATNGKFRGKFINFTWEGSRLNIGEVRTEDGGKCGNFKFFFKWDVVDVRVLSSGGDNNTSVSLDETTSSGDRLETNDSSSSRSSSIKVSEEQLVHISNNINQFVYIRQADEGYFKAIADISKHFAIGIDVNNAGEGRFFNTNLITISTTNKIYIFDVLALKTERTAADLRKILESDDYLKVVYDYRRIKDNLSSRFDTKLEPFFDLLLISAQTYKKQEVVGLSNCIETVLGVDNMISDKGISLKRPISQDDLRDIATKTAYHLAMHTKLVQKDLSSRMIKATRDFLDKNSTIAGFVHNLDTTKAEKDLDETLSVQSQSNHMKVDFKIYLSDSN